MDLANVNDSSTIDQKLNSKTRLLMIAKEQQTAITNKFENLINQANEFAQKQEMLNQERIKSQSLQQDVAKSEKELRVANENLHYTREKLRTADCEIKVFKKDNAILA